MDMDSIWNARDLVAAMSGTTIQMEGFRNGMMGVELSVTADSCDTI